MIAAAQWLRIWMFSISSHFHASFLPRSECSIRVFLPVIYSCLVFDL